MRRVPFCTTSRHSTVSTPQPAVGTMPGTGKKLEVEIGAEVRLLSKTGSLSSKHEAQYCTVYCVGSHHEPRIKVAKCMTHPCCVCRQHNKAGAGRTRYVAGSWGSRLFFLQALDQSSKSPPVRGACCTCQLSGSLESVTGLRGLCCTVQYSTEEFSTVQYSTVQYSTVLYSTVQYCSCGVMFAGVYLTNRQFATNTYGGVGGFLGHNIM